MRGMSMRGVVAVQAWMVALRDRNEGATAAEYALLVALIAVAILVAIKFLGSSISGVFNTTGSTMSSLAT